MLPPSLLPQRKPRDPAAIQRLIAASQMKQPSLQHQAQAIAFTTSQPSAQPQSVAKPVAQVMQPSFPQGSILVVPHPQHPFHTVLPVFATPSVVMPQGTSPQGVAHVVVTQPGESAVPTTSVIQSSLTAIGKQEQTEEKQKKKGEDVGMAGSKEKGAMEGGDKKGHEGAKKSDEPVNAQPKVKGSDGIREKLVASAITSVTPLLPPSSVHQPSIQAAVAMTPEGRPVLIPAHAAAAMAATQPFVFPQGIPAMPVYAVKLPEPVPLSAVDFESKSIEITGEVPIRKVDLQEERGAIADEGRLPLEAKVPGEDDKEAKKETVDGKQEKETKASVQEKEKEVVKPPKPKDGGVIMETLRGHTSQEVMSAKMLLSLTGRQGLSSPLDKDAPPSIFTAQAITQELNEAVVRSEHLHAKAPAANVASPASGSAPQTPSGGRKRKQKPTPSARAGEPSSTLETAGDKSTPTVASARAKRIRREKKTDVAYMEDGEENKDQEVAETSKHGRTKQAKSEERKPGKSQEFTAQELLAILEIPPSAEGEVPSMPTKAKPQKTSTPKGSRGRKGVATKSKNVDGKADIPASKAMQQLKAGRENRPLKEFIIETDTESGDDSDSSTSGTSSGFSPDSGSSSDSSSNSSSESAPSESKTPQKGAARGRGGRGRGGRGRGRGRASSGGHARKNSSSDESSSEEESPEATGGGRARRGGGPRGRGRAVRGVGRARGHIVRIPTKILSHKPSSGKKRKAIRSHEV